MKKHKEISDFDRLDKIFGYADVVRKYSKGLGRYRIIRYTLPNWTLSPLFNGDYMDAEDYDLLEAFLKKEGLNSPIASANIGFCHNNDLNDLGDDCSWVIFRLDGWK